MMTHSVTDEFLFSGTVGDAYIALCKLAARARARPCRLRRLERQAGADATIAAIAGLFPGVDYDEDFEQFATIAQMRSHAFRHAGRYLSIFWDRNGRGNEPNDPPELVFTPFPSISLAPVMLGPRPKRLGFQLQSGSRARHLRILDADWVAAVCRSLHGAQIDIVLLGTSDGLTEADRRSLTQVPENCTDLIGRTSLTTWLSHVASLDLLITTDGLAAFFALSQRVRTLMAFTEPEAVLRLAPEWNALASCVWPQGIAPDPHGQRWVPIALAQAVSMILACLDPNALAHDAGQRPWNPTVFITG